jgi:hypothetical protein
MLSDLLAVATRRARVVTEDVWYCTLSPDGRYSVKSMYASLLKGLTVMGTPQGEVLQAVSRVWKSWVPSKVIVFSWKLLLDRIPSRSNLLMRGVPLLVGGVECVFCHAPSESAAQQVSRWLGWEFVMPLGLAQQFQAFIGLGGGRELG